MSDPTLCYKVNPEKKYTSFDCLEDTLFDDDTKWVEEDDEDDDDEFIVTDPECMQQIYCMMTYEKKPITIEAIKKEFQKSVMDAHKQIEEGNCIAPEAIYDTAGLHQHIVDNAEYLIAKMVELEYLLVSQPDE